MFHKICSCRDKVLKFEIKLHCVSKNIYHNNIIFYTFKKYILNIFIFMFELIYLYIHNSLSNSDYWTVNFEVPTL